MTTSLDMLESISKFTNSTDRKPKLAIVDVNFDPLVTPLPRVTFEGETTMTDKFYPVMGHLPFPGQRVVMLPVGNTYIILGEVNPSSVSTRLIGVFSSSAFQNCASGAWVYLNWNYALYNPLGVTPGLSIIPPLPGLYTIDCKVAWNGASGSSGSSNLAMRIQKNFNSDPSAASPAGSSFFRGANPPTTATRSIRDAVSPFSFNGTTDYLRVGIQQNTGVTMTTRPIEGDVGLPGAASTLMISLIGR